MIIYFDVAADGSIYQTTAVNPPQKPFGTVYLFDSSTANVEDAQQNASWYQVVNGALVATPRFALASTEANGQYTITATLNNPPTTPPAQATFTVLGQTINETITNGQATLTLALHPSLAEYAVSISVTATGCVGASASIGGTQTAPAAMQVYTPSGGVPTIVPTGAGSKAFLAAFYAMSPASLQSLLADIGTAVSLLTDTVFNVLLPVSTATLSADQQSAVNDIKTSILPNLYTTLANAYPSGGTKQVQYVDYAKDMASSFKAYENYMADLQNIPNLA